MKRDVAEFWLILVILTSMAASYNACSDGKINTEISQVDLGSQDTPTKQPCSNGINYAGQFNSSQEAYLSRTTGPNANPQVWTFSSWVNWNNTDDISQNIILLNTGTDENYNGLSYVYIPLPESIRGWALIWRDVVAGSRHTGYWSTDALIEPGWHHVLVSVDYSQAIASNKVSVWVDGYLLSGTFTGPLADAFSPPTDTLINSEGKQVDFFTAANILGFSKETTAFDGHIANLEFIDGAKLTGDDFGKRDLSDGSWKPKPYENAAGYGSGGFQLKFDPTEGEIGTDHSGNGNNVGFDLVNSLNLFFNNQCISE